MTINKFNDGSRFITGNRCERGAGKDRQGGDTGKDDDGTAVHDAAFDLEPMSATAIVMKAARDR